MSIRLHIKIQFETHSSAILVSYIVSRTCIFGAAAMNFAEKSNASRHARNSQRFAAHANDITLPEGFISWLRYLKGLNH